MSDIIIIAVLALAAVLGLFKGVLKAVLRFVEGILTFGLSAGVAFLVLTILGGEPNTTNIVIAIAAFLVMFIVSIIFLDYFLNRIVYSRKSKTILKDRIAGLIINLLLWTAILFVVYAIINTLQGTEYDHFYLAVTDKTILTKFFVNWNPFKTLIGNLFTTTTIEWFDGTQINLTQVLVRVLTALWPNFEYLG